MSENLGEEQHEIPWFIIILASQDSHFKMFCGTVCPVIGQTQIEGWCLFMLAFFLQQILMCVLLFLCKENYGFHLNTDSKIDFMRTSSRYSLTKALIHIDSLRMQSSLLYQFHEDAMASPIDLVNCHG